MGKVLQQTLHQRIYQHGRKKKEKCLTRTSLVVQWVRICFPKQEAQVQSRCLRSRMLQGN